MTMCYFNKIIHIRTAYGKFDPMALLYFNSNFYISIRTIIIYGMNLYLYHRQDDDLQHLQLNLNNSSKNKERSAQGNILILKKVL